MSVPFYFHIHGHPSDYWRFTPQALGVLLDAYPSKVVGWHGPARRPASVWALAFLGNTVVWRGQRLRVLPGGKLVPVAPKQP